MKDGTYDRLLIALAWIGPALLIVLNGWQASLDRWYAPDDGPTAFLDPDQLERTASDWLRARRNNEKGLYLLTDRQCPCTQVTVKKISDAVKQMKAPKVHLTVIDVNDSQWSGDDSWKQLLANVPSTPTLIAADGVHVLYAGLAVDGSFCTSKVQQLLGLAVLQASPDSAIINWLGKGCYCPIRHRVM